MAADSGRPGLDRARLEQLVAERTGHRGIRNLRELITDDPKETQAENERRMLRICRRFGIPEPATQYEIHTAGRTFSRRLLLAGPGRHRRMPTRGAGTEGS